MQHEKIFRNEDGSRTKVCVSLYLHSFRKEHEYTYHCLRCEKGKRTWIKGSASDEQVFEAKNELWQSLKPR